MRPWETSYMEEFVVEKIYFDMDGVLADFERGVNEICGLVPPSQNAKHHKPGEDDETMEQLINMGILQRP